MENAIATLPQLNDIKIQEMERIAEQQAEGKRGTRYKYSTYLHLLKDAAKVVDHQRLQKSKRSSNVHEGRETSEESSDMVDWNTAFHAFHALQAHASRIESDTWSKLDETTKKAWAKIGAKEQEAIAESFRKGPERKINYTDILGPDEETEENAEVDDKDDGNDDPPSGMAMEAKRTQQEVNELKGKAHPGDVRRVLGNNKGKTAKGSANNVRWNINTIRRIDHEPDSDNESYNTVEEYEQSDDEQSQSHHDERSELEDWGVNLHGGTLVDTLEEFWGEQDFY